MLIFRNDYLHLIAAVKRGIKRHNFTINFCTYTMMPNLTVNFKRKVNRSRIKWKPFQISFRSENINFILVKIELKVLDQIFLLFIFGSRFKNISDPINPVFQIFIGSGFTFFISPMSSKTTLGNFVHTACSDLNLD